MLQTLLLTIYTLIMLVFLDNTYREGEAAAKGWDLMRCAGLAFCVVWPLMIVHVTVLAYRGRHAR